MTSKKKIIYKKTNIFSGEVILFKIKVPIEKAKEIKYELRSLIICRPTQAESDCYLSGRQTSYFYSVVFVNLLEVWIFNKKTGEIYLKERLLG